MGGIMHSDLEGFNLVNIPAKPTNAVRVIRIAYENTVIIELEVEPGMRREFCIARQIDVKPWAFPLSSKSWSWQVPFVQALAKLGLLTKSQVQKIKDDDASSERAKVLRHKTKQLDQCVEYFGFELTDQQKELIK